jgi:plasmid stabilization system protein ParE
MADSDASISLIWTPKAIVNTIEIKGYLAAKFTQREIDNFYSLLFSFEKIVVIFPELYSVTSKSKKIRRAVLSKQLSVFYKQINTEIFIIAVLDNRMGYNK